MSKQDNFQILSDKQHVLKRPGMYIGSVDREAHERFVLGEYKQIEYVPGLVKIINEVIDNSLDEAIRTKFKFANVIEVKVEGNRITIADNGRGIPQDKVIDPHGNELLRPEAAWTRTKAGSNFEDDRTTVGMNGVGAALTNYFSHQFIGKTCDGKNTVTVSCSNNAERIFVRTSKGGTQGTSVEFIPDFNRFGVFGISPQDEEIIKDRLAALSVAFPEITFKYNGKKHAPTLKQYAKMFGTDVSFEFDNVALFIAASDEFRHNSFINGVHTINGGTHVDYFSNKLADELIPMIKRKHKINVPKPQLKNGLTIGLFIRNFVDPKFDSQTKERLTSSQGDVSPYLKDISYDKIAKKILADDDIIMPIIEALLAKQHAAEARELARKQKKAQNAKVADHIKATMPGGTLFLTEGKSAIGYLIKVRDSKKHGGIPLRGKVLSTWGKRPAKIMENKELCDIMSVLNIQLGNDDIRDMYYHDIGILVDADVDGKGSIFPLLLAFFYNWPELYKQKRIKFVRTPVVIATNKKETKWFYSIDEYRKAKLSKTWKIRYIKGLGSLTEKEYKKVINEPVFDEIVIDDPSCFELLFGDDTDKRKDWMTQ
ncbi:type 2 topoisomerase subunit B [Vibrio phage VH1_2019]|uniref:DNA topoisomerase (ATP-hydrolyzing) n=2 Tax=Schizotequatrovirus KVP40 TaxID=1914019 RepID=A0A6B9SW93_9CAUD|nr:DNA gyrase subunit B [Vibrio phage phi-pp2]QHJ74227.1 type 2 topoisomerase subunit B [Vibrio phage VH1_2019]